MFRGCVNSCVLLCVLFAAGGSAFAQQSDRASLVGHVTGPSGEIVAGATVRLESAALIGGPREVATDEAGTYRLANLTPGRYRLEVRAPQLETAVREAIWLEADARLVIDVALAVAPVTESIQVSATWPVVDVTSADAPIRFSRELLENLPSRHVVSGLLNLAPGVNVDVGLGGVQGSNPIFIDGVNVTSADTLAPWAAYDYNWLEDVQVVGVGASAQYGEFNGVVQKGRLRSGGNRFSALGEVRTTRPSWASHNTETLSSDVRTSFSNQSERMLDWWDVSLQVGGPVKADHLWFFGGFERSHHDVKPALYDGDSSINRRDRRLLIKIDSALSKALRASGHYEHDRHDVSGDDLGPLTPTEATTTDAQPDHNWQVRLSAVFGHRTTIEVTDRGSRGTLSLNPTPPATRAGPYPRYDASTGLSSGNAPTFSDWSSARHTIGATLTYAASGGSSRTHEVIVGIEHEWTRTDTVFGFPGDRSYVDLDGQPYLLYVWAPEYRSSRVRRFTAYAADRWGLGRVTLEPGVRVALNRGLASQGSVLSSHPVSPRLGVAWDVGASHTTVLRGHVGRYHDAMLTVHAGMLDTAPESPVIEYEIGPSGDLTETWRSTSSSLALDAGIRPPFFDQWTVGVERQLAAATSVTVQYVGRVYRAQQGFVDLGSIYVPVVRTDPGPDGRLGTSDDGGPLTVYQKTNPGQEQYIFTNPPNVGRRLDALQIIVRRRDARALEAQASYTYSSARGRAVNGMRANSGGPDLGTNGVAADPNRAINADGPMPFDFTHEAKVLAVWRVPRSAGMRVSGVYQVHTGNAWGRTAQISNLQQVVFGVRIEPRGTRRTPALNTLDLRIDKTFRLPGASAVTFFADVFNVGNQGIPDPSVRRPLFEVSGPSFARPLAWLSPRTLYVGTRVVF